MAFEALNPGFGQDLQVFDKFLKEWYMSKWIDLLNNLTTSYKLFRRRIVPFKGRRMVIALRTARSGAVQAIPLSGYQGTSQGAPATVIPGYQGTDNAHVRPKVIMCAIGVPQDVIDVSATDQGAFYDVIDFEMMGIKTDCASYLDEMVYKGGAPLGILKNRDTDTLADYDDWTVDNANYFFKNKRLQVWEPSSTNERSTHATNGHFTVQSTARASRLVNVDFDSFGSADPIANDDEIYTVGARNGDTAFEMLGLDQIVSDSNLGLKTYENNQYYLNIDRTANDDWSANVVHQAGALTFAAMQQMIDDIHDNSGGEPSVILTTRAIRRNYAKKCGFEDGDETKAATMRFINTVRYEQGLVSMQEDSHYAGGNDYMQFDGRLPIIVDRYCSQDDSTTNGGNMFFVDTRHFYYALVTDWKWWAPEGRILREAPNSLFGVVAHAYIMGDLVNDAPNTSGLIDQIAI